MSTIRVGRLTCMVMMIAAWLPLHTRAEDKLEFNRDIRPILSDKCFACHGPDQNHREADLRLDVRESALDSNAIVPGKLDESTLVKRILSDNPKRIMPPPHANKPLTVQQKETLRRWVAEGAEYQGHWAYLVPHKPTIAAGKQPIDALVQQRLAKRGLKASPEADRRTLARRLYFDLLGLPPKPEDVEAFENDKSPDAYAKLIDKLLASSHYGERLAIAWLDVVRFADTIGYHSDTPRNVYPYRDYVIRAFNDNKPFDQFAIEQIAGDLLPNATQEQKVASCFNRLLLTTEEGGAQAKDYDARMLGDRVRAMGTVWLGQTIGCCQCHDHKFDPATQRDFYTLGAFFADVQEAAIGKREPGMIVPDEKQAAELKRLQVEVARLQQRLDSPRPELVAAQQAWEKLVLAEVAQPALWTTLKPTKATAEQAKLTIEKSDTILADANAKQPTETYVVTASTSLKNITGFRLDALSHVSLPANGPGRGVAGSFVVTDFAVEQGKTPLKLVQARATYEHADHPAAAAIDGNTQAKSGWGVGSAGGEEHAICFELAEPIGEGSELTLTFRIAQQAGEQRSLGRFQLAATTSSKPIDAPALVLPTAEVVDLVKLDPANRNAAQQARLSAHFKSTSRETVADRWQLARAKQALAAHEDSLPRCLVAVSMTAPRTVRLLPRGNWMDESGPIVQPAFLSYLPQPKFVEGKRLTRLDLAQWVVSRENPLTARVFVNRVWKQFFGIGLSKSLEDLGSQGESPVNPELLDWLACEFIDSGWNVKQLVRTIVGSHTYRQVSTAPKAAIVRDPENRELARQSRFRFDAELVRDNALAISGLLVSKVGGPSVKPYQPDGYWENLNFPTRAYAADTGENQYRRGLYTWWQRSFLHPSMLAFDAPSREECAADRSRSNIPQQALVLLNDPTYVEAARAFGTRILREGGTGADARITWAWRQALSRVPNDNERTVASAVFEKHFKEFTNNDKAADEFLKVALAPAPSDVSKAELAAWTSVARVILNLHETITRN